MTYEAPEPRGWVSRLRRILMYFLVIDALVAGVVLLRAPVASLWAPPHGDRAADGAAATPVLAPLLAQAPQATLDARPTRAPYITGATPGRKPLPTATLGPVPQPPLAGGPVVQAKVEIVWPHGGAGWADADLANVTVFLLQENGVASVPCDFNPVVRLWRAEDTQPARPIAIGQKRMFSSGGRIWPVWDFNDVNVSPARDPAGRLKFFATVDGTTTEHNVWVHGADSRTIFARVDEPASVTALAPAVVDARIEILWPHDDAPPGQARLANLVVYLFDAQSGQALAPEIAWHPQVRLHWSLNNDADKGPASSLVGSQRTVTTSNGVQFLAWDFNDVNISPALDSLNKLHFWVTVDDRPMLSNVWTHGAVAATIQPQSDVLTSCE